MAKNKEIALVPGVEGEKDTKGIIVYAGSAYERHRFRAAGKLIDRKLSPFMVHAAREFCARLDQEKLDAMTRKVIEEEEEKKSKAGA